MKKKKLTAGIIVLCMALTMGGCGRSASFDKLATESITSPSAPMVEEYKEVFFEDALYDGPVEMETITEAGAGGENSGAAVDGNEVSGKTETDKQAQAQERKLIKTVDMTVETKEFDATLAVVKEKTAELGGYIENLETYNGSSYSTYRSSRNANMTIRIPKQQLDTFLDTVSGVSNVVRRSESVEDVTLTYVDLDSHKRVLLAEQETLLGLMEQAKEIEDIITIESRLSQVRYQIESMESQLRTYDNKVNYSTIYLYVNEVKELTPVKEETVWQRISGGFVNSLREIKEGAVESAIWFAVNIPYFVVWAVVLVVLFVVTKTIFKGRKFLKNKKKEKTTAENNKENK